MNRKRESRRAGELLLLCVACWEGIYSWGSSSGRAGGSGSGYSQSLLPAPVVCLLAFQLAVAVRLLAAAAL